MSGQSLESLMQLAETADGTTRIEYRDRLAAFGDAAIDAVRPWLADARLGAFAVRVLGKIAESERHQQQVAETLSQVSAIGSAAVARDIRSLADRIDSRVRAAREVREYALAQEARRIAAEEQRLLEERLAQSRAKRVREAARWLAAHGETTDEEFTSGDAENLVLYLDRVDSIRRSMNLGELQGVQRTTAAQAWVRSRSGDAAEKRISFCWRCRSTVYSDLNPKCPRCQWMVCACDACRDPEHKHGACPRMADQLPEGLLQ